MCPSKPRVGSAIPKPLMSSLWWMEATSLNCITRPMPIYLPGAWARVRTHAFWVRYLGNLFLPPFIPATEKHTVAQRSVDNYCPLSKVGKCDISSQDSQVHKNVCTCVTSTRVHLNLPSEEDDLVAVCSRPKRKGFSIIQIKLTKDCLWGMLWNGQGVRKPGVLETAPLLKQRARQDPTKYFKASGGSGFPPPPPVVCHF